MRQGRWKEEAGREGTKQARTGRKGIEEIRRVFWIPGSAPEIPCAVKTFRITFNCDTTLIIKFTKKCTGDYVDDLYTVENFIKSNPTHAIVACLHMKVN